MNELKGYIGDEKIIEHIYQRRGFHIKTNPQTEIRIINWRN